ncbi:hypothetical protein PUN28_015424 [Cardiocondyla obscurior]|uniref:Uncharacterized protein n=1 Tax=Cardiocondyla obscurior TaxID=286306 RepID=A0AAW2EWL6_9HYME
MRTPKREGRAEMVIRRPLFAGFHGRIPPADPSRLPLPRRYRSRRRRAEELAFARGSVARTCETFDRPIPPPAPDFARRKKNSARDSWATATVTGFGNPLRPPFRFDEGRFSQGDHRSSFRTAAEPLSDILTTPCSTNGN